jgi:hypothetical protein
MLIRVLSPIFELRDVTAPETFPEGWFLEEEMVP